MAGVIAPVDTPRFSIVVDGRGRARGVEKPCRVYSGDDRVFVQELRGDIDACMTRGMDAAGAGNIFSRGDRVAVKVNIGGGIDGVLPTYTDPDLLRGVMLDLLRRGCEPFVCEANMRGHEITSRLLAARGYVPMLRDAGVPFVNLSTVARVPFRFLGFTRDVNLPAVLLDPAVKIVSMAPPKHHWECGITCAQKNMYGAIADYKKSRFHRTYELIDHVVAAAARVMRPSLNVIATRQLGAGLGPHFSIPFDFDRAIIAPDMLACDACCAWILGFPVDNIKHFTINARGERVTYRLLPGSSLPGEGQLAKIRANAIPPATVELYKKTLFTQYFVPSRLQIAIYHRFEFLLTWLNHAFYSPRGDPAPRARVP